jgi:hypothetical protein
MKPGGAARSELVQKMMPAKVGLTLPYHRRLDSVASIEWLRRLLRRRALQMWWWWCRRHGKSKHHACRQCFRCSVSLVFRCVWSETSYVLSAKRRRSSWSPDQIDVLHIPFTAPRPLQLDTRWCMHAAGLRQHGHGLLPTYKHRVTVAILVKEQ